MNLDAVAEFIHMADVGIITENRKPAGNGSQHAAELFSNSMA